MKSINSILNADIEYEKLSVSLTERFKGAWNDSVHNSFLGYVNLVQDHSQRIHSIRCKAESLEKEVEELRIDETIKMTENLCQEAETV